MCDTMVALGSVTADGATLFAKNSDREPNEAQQLLRIPAARHTPGERVRCTFLEIPQVEVTYEVLLARPFWIWGAEMGANEHGLAIGNEAVFTRVPYDKGPGLIGMDFLRLALERTRTARQALNLITQLLARYGQGGNCGLEHTSYYHNSFLLADAHEAWVLETAGQQWAAERVRDIRSISNGLTIGNRWDLASPDLIAYAVERGWCRGADDFHFARCYSDRINTHFGRCRERQRRTMDMLASASGHITVETLMRALRDHGSAAGPEWSPAPGLFTFTVCAHAGLGPVRATGTAGSWVSHLLPDLQTHYVTGTAAPCTSLFKPVWLGGELPDTGPAPSSEYDAATLFWQHEQLHRATLSDYSRLSLYAAERDELEKQFIAGAAQCRLGTVEERLAFSRQCFQQAQHAEAHWLDLVRAHPARRRNGPMYTAVWRGFDRRAHMPHVKGHLTNK